MADITKPNPGSEIQSVPNETETNFRRMSNVEDIEKPADDAIPSQHAQLGVQKIEAITLSWSKLGLVALLVKYVPNLRPLCRIIIDHF
jgi:hypothetical protein